MAKRRYKEIDDMESSYVLGRIANAQFVNIRSEPSADSEVLTTLSKGDSIKVTGSFDLYYEVIFVGERRGYVLKEYCDLTNNEKESL